MFFLNLGKSCSLFYEGLRQSFAERGLLLFNVFEEDLLAMEGEKEVVLVIINNLRGLHRFLELKQKLKGRDYFFIEVSSFKNLQKRKKALNKQDNFITIPIMTRDLVDKVILLYLQQTVSHRILAAV